MKARIDRAPCRARSLLTTCMAVSESPPASKNGVVASMSATPRTSVHTSRTLASSREPDGTAGMTGSGATGTGAGPTGAGAWPEASSRARSAMPGSGVSRK